VPGVAGGVSPRSLANGQAPVVNPELLSASTALQQSGGGGYARLKDALQALDQGQNVATLASQTESNTSDIATIQGQITSINAQITSINGQIGVINGQISGLQSAIVTLTGEIGALQAQLGTLAFGAVGAPPTGVANASLEVTSGGSQYFIPLYP
jgi:prefoldin subunit 5